CARLDGYHFAMDYW
nr:immunoglobulin heavy chain junction region [Mus musculus]MBK4188621.1 immunoglobulin heavy chain junction region [Mus musculus]